MAILGFFCMMVRNRTLHWKICVYVYVCVRIDSKSNCAAHSKCTYPIKVKDFLRCAILGFRHSHSQVSEERATPTMDIWGCKFRKAQYIFGSNLEYLVNITVHFLLKGAVFICVSKIRKPTRSHFWLPHVLKLRWGCYMFIFTFVSVQRQRMRFMDFSLIPIAIQQTLFSWASIC